jgi:hypothetical protein
MYIKHNLQKRFSKCRAFASAVNLPVTGLSGKIYITNDDNKITDGMYNIPTFVNYRNRNNKLLPKFTGASTLGIVY